MGKIHQLVMTHGAARARDMVSGKQRQHIDIAAEILANEERSLGITYSGFCLTGFPHKRLADDAIWKRSGHNVTLLVEPGHLLVDGEPQLIGVPYGARARIILIYLQTEAIRTGSREVKLGRSMREWTGRMGLSIGGETLRSLRDQARRISACDIKFFWTQADEKGRRSDGFSKGAIVKSGLFFRDGDDRQAGLFDDVVTLDETFYEALRDHPVPLLEAAIIALKDRSLSLDLYIWLAYRLQSLQTPASLSWASVTAQFGGGFKVARQFKTTFLEALGAALAAYPEARIDVEADGIVLHPSKPPIPRLTR